jgi:hypothetical protein
MAFDPELIAETRAWFAKAFNDLRAAEVLTTTSPALFDEAVFWKFRYPGEPFQPGPGEVAEAFATARGVFEAAVSRLPFDARP